MPTDTYNIFRYDFQCIFYFANLIAHLLQT
jgi:hypothetical protein